MFLLASAYICGMTASMIKKLDGYSIEIVYNEYRLIQRAVAADDFHGFLSKRFDTVTVSKCDRKDERKCPE